MDDPVKLFSALLTPVIAIVTTYIAIQQYRILKFKIRHELFERRLSIYKAVIEYLSAVSRQNPPADESAIKMFRETADGRFLFKDEVTEYLDQLYKKGIDLSTLNMELQDHTLVGDERIQKVNQRADLKLWLAKQYTVTYETFKKYLSLNSK